MSYLSIIKRVPLMLGCSNIMMKQMSTSAVCSVGSKWREANGYPSNLTSRGILTDGPDYSFVDGKPTPYTTGQRARILRQKEYAEKIHRFLSITEKCKKAYQENLAAKQIEKDKILGRKLKPKGINRLKSK